MASPELPSALDARTQAFPELSEAQIERIRPFGRLRHADAGEVLFEPGAIEVPFFVVLSGEVAIVQPGLGGERLIISHGPRDFTGEMTMITAQRSVARGRATAPGELIELSQESLRALIAKDAELSEVFMRAFILRRLELVKHGRGGAVLLGSRHSASTLRLREFLVRTAYPFVYLDLDADGSAQQLLDRFQVGLEEIPVVICGSGAVLRNPTPAKLADCLGLNSAVKAEQVRDVVIVGAGPSGLAAAVYAASEGLDALVVEAEAPGGQAGSSSKIENYLGFPVGVSGLELVDSAIAQAEKFGARTIVAHAAVRLDCGSRPFRVVLDDTRTLAARTVVISTGAQYNKPSIAGLERFEGRGIYYSATFLESQLCRAEDVIVIGGGNSAGQAAVFLSQIARKVTMLVRSGQLRDTMSRYLIQRIEENPAIELHFETQITGLDGASHLERVSWQDGTGQVSEHEVRHVFIMAGASPRTEWLRGCVALDAHGFILTGRSLDAAGGAAAWPLARAPQMLETSVPGIFAVGDARSGNFKRVASAVGEGAIAVQMIHRALAEM